MDGTKLPGFLKKSFAMYFGGGEIWFEHLDGIHEFSQLAAEKLEKDYLEFKRPSKPSLIAVNVDETVISDRLLQAIAEKLTGNEKQFTRVVIVGAGRADKHRLKKVLSGGGFALNFIDDFEKAKEWLVSETGN